MLVKIPEIRNTLIADLSGSELEVLHRILAKTRFVNLSWMGNRQVDVVNPDAGKPEFTLEVVPSIEQVSLQEFMIWQDGQRIESRASQAAGILDDANADKMEAAHNKAKRLRDELCYTHDKIPYSLREAYAWEPQSVEHDVVDFMAVDKPTVRVHRNGTVETFPA